MSAENTAEFKAIMAAVDKLEIKMKTVSEQADGQVKTVGKVSEDTAKALESFGNEQKLLADRMLQLEQKGGAKKDTDRPDVSLGGQAVAHEAFKAWKEGGRTKIRMELDTADFKKKNTVVEGTGSGSNAMVAPMRLPEVIPGPFRTLKVEDMLLSATTDTNAVMYTRELSFTNNAAEVAEAAAKPETSITFELKTVPVQNIAHWIKISRQLSMDAPALAAYINNRMRYGVNKRAEDQIIAGNGTDPNIAGILATGNYTAHGYANSNLGTVNKILFLIRKIIADLATSDYPADMIILNPQDWATIELLTDSQGRYIIGNPQQVAQPMLWGLPVLTTNAMPVDTVIVMSRMAATVYNREGTVIEMSESDSDNFTKNLITIRAERRLMLAVEIPAAIRAGDLTPA